MEDDVRAQEAKGKIYQFFARIFAKEPTLELLRLSQQQDNAGLFKSYGVDLFSDLKHLSLEQQQESLAIEYTRLFLTPPRLASPIESLQRSEARLWGESTVEVDKIYKKFGFELDDDFKDTPDHLSAELEFLAKLATIELEYTQGSLFEARRGVLEVKKYFLKEHLLKWFFCFKKKVIKHARLRYYREIIEFLGMFLNEEWEGLKEIKDISQ